MDTIEQTAEFALLETIAVALRAELGAAIEEQPAYRDPTQAGQVNRAFRAIARVVLGAITLPDEGLSTLLSRVLMRLTWRRLAASGLDARHAEFLLQVERDRDDWLAFLLLTTDPEIEHLLETEGPDRKSSGAAPPSA